MIERPGKSVERRIFRYDGVESHSAFDSIVTEEPLEIRLFAAGDTRTLAVTMRTPGNDFELAAGFLFTEGIIDSIDDIVEITYCTDSAVEIEQRYNIVNVALRFGKLPDMSRFERHFTVNSSCGVCGRANLDELRERIEPIQDDVTVTFETVASLPHRMREAQHVFDTTGGLHAATLFSNDGELLCLREDVGRHNALDKLIGWALTNRRSMKGSVLFVSGRASYEILQKAAVARIPVVCSVSAPSSLAVDLADTFNVTLAGFVRGQTANIYSMPQRVLAQQPL